MEAAFKPLTDTVPTLCLYLLKHTGRHHSSRVKCVTAPLPCRYGLFLTCLAISILFSEGWIGPVTCLVTQILPPELKAFGVSLWCAIANIIMPAGNVLFGIYLMVRFLLTPATYLTVCGVRSGPTHCKAQSCFWVW